MKGVIINPGKKVVSPVPENVEVPVQESVQEALQQDEKNESVVNNLGNNLVQTRPMITPEEK